MTNFSQGRAAEDAAAEYLEKHGYEIVDRNWRTRYCEIDIVAKKDKTAHFIEVKYRLSDAHGSGFEYITPTKLKRMRFAAELWVQENNWGGGYALGALEVSGPEFEISNFLPVVQ